MTDKVAIEVAEAEFDRWAENRDLLLDTPNMSAKSRDEIEGQKYLMMRELQTGSLVFDEKMNAIYTPRDEDSTYRDPICFRKRSGATLLASDKRKSGEDAGKTYAMMAQMCRIPANSFSKLVGTDIKVCEAIFQLLMA